jgi:defect-in-organelle-trafficking protein DotC
MTIAKKSLIALAATMAWTGIPSAQAQVLNGLEWKDPKIFVAGQTPPPPSLESLMADRIVSAGAAAAADAVSSIRGQALQEAAVSLGARAGLARGLNDKSAALERKSANMDANYRFSSVVISIPMKPGTAATRSTAEAGNGEYAMILPPVILEARDADSFPNDDEMRIADRVYKIHAKAKLIQVDKRSGHPVAPSWRDYLVFSFAEVQTPHQTLLPRNEAEKAIWNEWLRRGWDEGIKQADQMFDAGWARLNRDFKGMLNYRLAYSQGLATKPEVAGVYMGVTGGGSEMRLNDRTIRITDHSSLVADPSKWKSPDPK